MSDDIKSRRILATLRENQRILKEGHQHLGLVIDSQDTLIKGFEVLDGKLTHLEIEHGGRLSHLEAENDMHRAHWTVASWMTLHGCKASRDAMKDEGSRLRVICLDNGFAVPRDKVNMGSVYPARQWPIEAIRIWWPDCCARHGWPVEWKV